MDQKTKHTPGPWNPHYAKGDHCLSSSVWGQEPGNQVAVIGGKSLEIMNANAALIAAAPAMYEAIRKVIEHRAKDYLDNTIEPYCSLVAALAQAEGK